MRIQDELNKVKETAIISITEIGDKDTKISELKAVIADLENEKKQLIIREKKLVKDLSISNGEKSKLFQDLERLKDKSKEKIKELRNLLQVKKNQLLSKLTTGGSKKRRSKRKSRKAKGSKRRSRKAKRSKRRSRKAKGSKHRSRKAKGSKRRSKKRKGSKRRSKKRKGSK